MKKFASPDDPNCVLIAEDDDLACILYGVKAAPFQLEPETLPSNQPFYVALLAADHTSLCSSL
ncbi:hypothetical protein [Leisingera sp. ANG-Vp]|uniref:hypothetical protein n=1 Tax=Leisingera sp. ANG-Vp TaxID=1577896 RepID=UPI00057DBEE4|nr:hypothetical protein RA20_05305 [Leisingera sp. ANG-Vp]